MFWRGEGSWLFSQMAIHINPCQESFTSSPPAESITQTAVVFSPSPPPCQENKWWCCHILSPPSCIPPRHEDEWCHCQHPSSPPTPSLLPATVIWIWLAYHIANAWVALLDVLTHMVSRSSIFTNCLFQGPFKNDSLSSVGSLNFTDIPFFPTLMALEKFSCSNCLFLLPSPEHDQNTATHFGTFHFASWEG